MCDADTGEIVRSGTSRRIRTAPRSIRSCGGRPCRRPSTAAGGLDDVAAVSVGAQQHGMVCLDDAGAVVRDALLWNDTRSSCRRRRTRRRTGRRRTNGRSASAWCPSPRSRRAKLRWLADHEPAHADATAAVCLPHDWLTWRLTGSTDVADLRTDRSDASGTGYFSAEDRQLPARPARDGDAGTTTRVADGARSRTRPPGDLERCGARARRRATTPRRRSDSARSPGDCVVSLGTSGVVSAVGDVAPHDPEGIVAGFRRCDRTPVAACLHAQRRTGAGRGRHDARRGLRRTGPVGAVGAGRRRGTHAGAVLRG